MVLGLHAAAENEGEEGLQVVRLGWGQSEEEKWYCSKEDESGERTRKLMQFVRIYYLTSF